MADELRDEYTFDYKQAKPNRFAAAIKKGGRLEVIDPEVAAAFRESSAVNTALRSLLPTMPGPTVEPPTKA
ncbi:MAG TPA: hypothetical protein VHR66_28315 [Gemmataceae bacterium]|jgi:hypothetical protein|nr:hypothetical protein [Gemmataceae bacterium]